ncbi:Uu.00g027510.m01.CDS01 [Anthostomella pinea]|uniref:Uu.00g027510.m01.CDS01 n=1 Tax=Anthostomella pinea TaxID=933095 RepID=A0AAI8V2X6_9PEZI|nr:Uu.00g027510.m01.CDS01 [Anthostomella pinea]
MSSIGPQLPPHLAKRKRTPDDDTPADSPPTKVHATERSARANQDELDLGSDSDSDDNYGPSAPNPTSRPTVAGPAAPPPSGSIEPLLAHSQTDEIAIDSDDGGDDDIGPSAPPPPRIRPPIGPAGPPPPPPTPPGPNRIHGPAPPPAPLNERPSQPANTTTKTAASDSDSSEDDDYGPALPTSTSHHARQTALHLAQAQEAAASGAPKRDDWMLAPPTSGGGYREVDPTKIKSRVFKSGPRVSGSAGAADGEISSIWTETPEQKRKRLEAAVLGRDSSTTTGTSTRTTSSSQGVSGKPKSKEEAEQQARIRDFTEATRGRSLYEEHQAAKKDSKVEKRKGGKEKDSGEEEEEDDPSKRAFDREKDMKLGGRIGTAQRRELLNKSVDFGGRFAKGKFL